MFKFVKNFEAHGTCEDHRATGSSPSGPLITIQTHNNATRVQESIDQSLSRSE